jgi:hypothetical protein
MQSVEQQSVKCQSVDPMCKIRNYLHTTYMLALKTTVSSNVFLIESLLVSLVYK